MEYAAYGIAKSKNAFLVGMDIECPRDDRGRKVAPRNARIFYEGDCQAFDPDPSSSSPYKLAIAFQLIEHLDNPGAFVRGVRRALCDGGKFVVTTPNGAVRGIKNPQHRFEWESPARAGHEMWRWWSVGLRRAGEMITDVEVFGVFVHPWMFERERLRTQRSFVARLLRKIADVYRGRAGARLEGRDIRDFVTIEPLSERGVDVAAEKGFHHVPVDWLIVCSKK
jgi:SAM-dependent methyltransferase